MLHNEHPYPLSPQQLGVDVPPLARSRGGECAPMVDALREEEAMDEIRKELGDRVYGSTIGFGLAVGGLIVLLVLRCVIGL